MRKHHQTVHVAHGIDVRHVGLHIAVDGDAARRELHADVGEVERAHVGASTHSHQHLVGSHRLFLTLAFVSHRQPVALFGD